MENIEQIIAGLFNQDPNQGELRSEAEKAFWALTDNYPFELIQYFFAQLPTIPVCNTRKIGLIICLNTVINKTFSETIPENQEFLQYLFESSQYFFKDPLIQSNQQISDLYANLASCLYEILYHSAFNFDVVIEFLFSYAFLRENQMPLTDAHSSQAINILSLISEISFEHAASFLESSLILFQQIFSFTEYHPQIISTASLLSNYIYQYSQNQQDLTIFLPFAKPLIDYLALYQIPISNLNTYIQYLLNAFEEFPLFFYNEETGLHQQLIITLLKYLNPSSFTDISQEEMTKLISISQNESI